MDQINIFEMLYDKPKVDKPVRLIELFAGYGSQALALKYLGAKFEHWKIAEWNYKSFDAYNRIHFGDTTNYSKDKELSWLINYLYDKGISSNWDSPMTLDQIKRLSEAQIRKIYNDIQATHNLVNIQQTSAKDLDMNDNNYYYLLTYSFPCQDLSLAGLGKGMVKESGTRSSLLWEVGRLLKECHSLGKMPDALVMENVPQVHGADNSPFFDQWQLELEKLGYQSYWKDLVATDYGIPQTRNRTFMVSIRDGYFSFPKPIPLTKKLRDLLEKNVDERYYLSDKAINFFKTNSEKMQAKGNGFKWDVKNADTVEIAKTVTTHSGSRMDDNFIEIKRPHGYFPGSISHNPDAISTIDASIDYQHIVLGVYDDYNHSFRSPDTVGVIQANYPKPHHGNRVVSMLPTTMEDKPIRTGGLFDNDKGKHQAGSIYDPNGTSPTLDCAEGGHRTPLVELQKYDIEQTNQLRIRKLTPTECFRLMAVKDGDSLKLDGISNSTKYHLAGDSIVTTVLMAIFGELLEIPWESKVKSLFEERK